MTELLLSISLIATVNSSNPVPADTLADLKWKYRLLVVLYEDPMEPKAANQIAEWRKVETGALERDLVLIRAQQGGGGFLGTAPLSAEQVERLFETFGEAGEEVSIVLVGKDGTAKRRWSTSVPMSEVFEIIDAMPMRRREVLERAGGGRGP